MVVEQTRQHGLVSGVIHDDRAVGGHEPALLAVGLHGRGTRQPQDAALLGRMGFEARLVGVLQNVALIQVKLLVGAGRERFS